ncbi:hypothetical protein Lal_00023331 [Lupinus albus]|uniref:Putative ankyrin repeat-containing domain, PGG domain, protein accelerated cell death 6 n=1 Tax=Lupinus albus TaxID=3870 RepID=A0A6A4NSY1_LUPAL|nr:putative ankyrin repeat-containing domain, PGG domain, protein accelerated cell death 6 [Lupinus albus]KAF1881295.1 hypothetical protein Lal_00023331 [Lupinus albus]
MSNEQQQKEKEGLRKEEYDSDDDKAAWEQSDPPMLGNYLSDMEMDGPMIQSFLGDMKMGAEADISQGQELTVQPPESSEVTKPQHQFKTLPDSSDENCNFDELRDAYVSMMNGDSGNGMGIHDNVIFTQVTPTGNTVLHIAAMYGNDEWVEKTNKNAFKLLTAQNKNGDTALHVAARIGHISILNKLFTSLLENLPFSYTVRKPEILVETNILVQNKKGNSFFHEALYNGHEGVMSLLFDAEKLDKINEGFKELVVRIALTQTNIEDKSVLYLAVEAGYKEFIDKALFKLYHTQPQPQFNDFVDGDTKLIQKLFPKPHVVAGKSPLLAAIFKRDQDFENIMVNRVQEWMKLKDNDRRTPLHHAASIGYLNGVKYLLENCVSSASTRDKYGFFPLHLASDGGHVDVVHMLLRSDCCPYPREILDICGRNILHIAIQNGKFNVVKYILQSSNKELEKMINDKDEDGNTPLHYASLRCYPRIVYELIWDKRVNCDLVNNNHHTALDACMQFQPQNTSLRQRLTWIALKSAGVKSQVPQPFITTKVPSQSIESYWKHEAPKMDNYTDRISTLLVVSTLITTAAFAAGFAMPGGINGSDPGKGMSLLLDRVWFNVFIFCITISMYGAISATIILIWAQLGDIVLAILALKVAMPILGATLATLSIAFLAGVHLVITDLTWLATTSLVIGVVFILILLLLYFLLWLPSPSNMLILRYISHYPFMFLASLVDQDETGANPKHLHSSSSSVLNCTSQPQLRSQSSSFESLRSSIKTAIAATFSRNGRKRNVTTPTEV